MKLEIRIDDLIHELNELATLSERTPPAVTRVVFSQEDRSAKTYVKRLCAAAGLEVRVDAVGNTFARWVGKEPALAPVGSGSHIDAIPNAGMYDGTVGVLGALEAIRVLQRSGFQPKRSIELILFAAEEPTRFGIGCLGSRLLCGSLSKEAASKLRDKEGNGLDHWRDEAGLHGDLATVKMNAGTYSHFVELHIEQGPLLEKASLPIGLVTEIAAPASATIQLRGEGGHAGAVLMPNRKDALTAAAELILAIESAAKSTGAMDTVATVGICNVFPSAINSIPSEVTLSLDARDINLTRRNKVLASIDEDCRKVAEARGIEIVLKMLNADEPATCSSEILVTAERVCEGADIPRMKMVSRAYHDSLFMSKIAPTMMIFIPCRGGVSHRPDEYVSPEAIATGVRVLAMTLGELAMCP